MGDHLRLTRELVAQRRGLPALRRGSINVFHWNDAARVIAFHRWIEGEGQDVVVVATLNEATQYGYRIGMPAPGAWREVFNSDVYDHWVNPMVSGNGPGPVAGGGPLHGMPASADIVVPANSILMFSRSP
jgi:1,4-alpha-glucan branching enzyme